MLRRIDSLKKQVKDFSSETSNVNAVVRDVAVTKMTPSEKAFFILFFLLSLFLHSQNKDNRPKVRFVSLTSGSCGNCYCFRSGDTSIVIDAGIGVRTFLSRMKRVGMKVEGLSALFLTHDHSDHCRGASGLLDRFSIPLYCTHEVFDSINGYLRECEKISVASFRPLGLGQTVEIGPFQLTAFSVPHDSHTCVGYVIMCENECVVLVTDVGSITPVVEKMVECATRLIIETDFDEEMLWHGSYPELLKRRITSGYGHLSNRQTASLLQRITQIGDTRLKSVFLCHLSGQNNTPSLAFSTVREVLPSSVTLQVLPRGEATRVFEWN